MRTTNGRRAPVRGVPLLVLAALLGAANAAAASDDEGADSDWAVFAPSSSTGTVIAPTTPEGGFSSPDRLRFDEKLRAKVLDQLCRQIKLNQDFNFGTGDFSGTRVGIDRYLAPRLDNKLAVVDEERVRASYGHDFGKYLDGVTGGLGVGLYMSGSIEGKSMVVRPIDNVHTCQELDRLINVFDIKTVLPFTAERISKMQIGELWRVPFTLSYSQGLSLSDVLGENATLSISFGRSEAGAASLTLYRLSDDKTRFRFRVDHVVIKHAGLGIMQSIPALVFASGAENILMRFVDREISRQLARYTSAWLNGAIARSDGKRVLIEFVADSRDPQQARALAQALKGDFTELMRMGLRMSTLQVTDASTREAYERLRAEHSLGMGEPTYAAISEYVGKPRTFSLNIPFFIQHNVTSLFGTDKVTRLNGATGEFRYYRADRSRSNEFFNAPWVGPLVKNNEQRNAEVVTFAETGQKHSEPFIVYIHNEGYLRQRGSMVRRSIEEVNSILTLAGAQRGADSGRLAMPTSALPPAPPPPEPSEDDTMAGVHDPLYKGYFALTMVISPKGVREALGASAEQVLKAFGATMGADDRELVRWLSDNGRFGKGQLNYDGNAARDRFAPPIGSEAYDRTDALAYISREVAALVADITAARDAKTNEAKAEALATLMAGRGKSSLPHEKVLAVLIQFIDPLDLTGDYVSTIKGTSRHGKNLDAHYVLKKGRQEVPLLKEAGDTKSRFAEPSILVD